MDADRNPAAGAAGPGQSADRQGVHNRQTAPNPRPWTHGGHPEISVSQRKPHSVGGTAMRTIPRKLAWPRGLFSRRRDRGGHGPRRPGRRRPAVGHHPGRDRHHGRRLGHHPGAGQRLRPPTTPPARPRSSTAGTRPRPATSRRSPAPTTAIARPNGSGAGITALNSTTRHTTLPLDIARIVAGHRLRHHRLVHPVRDGRGGLVRLHRRQRPHDLSSSELHGIYNCTPITNWSQFTDGVARLPTPRRSTSSSRSPAPAPGVTGWVRWRHVPPRRAGRPPRRRRTRAPTRRSPATSTRSSPTP